LPRLSISGGKSRKTRGKELNHDETKRKGTEEMFAKLKFYTVELEENAFRNHGEKSENAHKEEKDNCIEDRVGTKNARREMKKTSERGDLRKTPFR